MLYMIFQFIPKCAIFLVYVQVISFNKIVADINIWVAIVVYIRYRHAQTKTDKTCVNTRLCGYFGKCKSSFLSK